MKRFLYLIISVIVAGLTASAQNTFTLQIDGVDYPFTKAAAGIEKVMNNELVGITFSSAEKTCALDFEYSKIKGKTAVSLSSEMDNQTYTKGFNLTYYPNGAKKEVWGTTASPASSLRITDYNEAKKTISGNFEVMLVQVMDADGKMVTTMSAKKVKIKGEFENLPITKVN